MYCFDTDVLSAFGRARPPAALVRRAVPVPPEAQSTTAITVGEIAYGLAKRDDQGLTDRMERILGAVWTVHPFDREAAGMYGSRRAQLEREGRRLAEPELRIASIAPARDLTVVTGNVKHFARVPACGSRTGSSDYSP